MQFWGDIVQHHPELIPEIPKDVIVLEWGYESDHPFAYRCKKIKETGIPFMFALEHQHGTPLQEELKTVLQILSTRLKMV